MKPKPIARRHIRQPPRMQGGELPPFANAQGRTGEEVRQVGERLISLCVFAILILAGFGLAVLLNPLWSLFK